MPSGRVAGPGTEQAGLAPDLENIPSSEMSPIKLCVIDQRRAAWEVVLAIIRSLR